MRPSLGCPFEVVGSFTVLEGRVGCTGVSVGAGVMIGSSGVSVGFGRIPGVTLGAGVTDGVSGSCVPLLDGVVVPFVFPLLFPAGIVPSFPRIVTSASLGFSVTWYVSSG